jgi:hypothetical protein
MSAKCQKRTLKKAAERPLNSLGYHPTIAAPLPDPGGILWEGITATGDNLELWVRLTPYESTTDQ